MYLLSIWILLPTLQISQLHLYSLSVCTMPLPLVHCESPAPPPLPPSWPPPHTPLFTPSSPPTPPPRGPHRTHQARALWLVGACGGELPREQWVDAWGLSVSHMGCSDLVVALMAVQAVLLLAVQLLDDQALLEQVGGAAAGVAVVNPVCALGQPRSACQV